MHKFIDDVKAQTLSKEEWTGKDAKGLTQQAGRETQDRIEQIVRKLQRGEALSEEETTFVQNLQPFSRPGWESPQELIERHTRWGNINEAELGKYLLDLVWMSPSQVSYVEQVFASLNRTDQDDVAFYFSSKATDSMLASIAVKSDGRELLNRLGDFLETGWTTGSERQQSDRIRRIVDRVVLDLREVERKMMRIPSTPFTLNVYPAVPVHDPPTAEVQLEAQAKMSPGTAIGVRDLVELLVRIPEESDLRRSAGLPHQLEAMSLGGHGGPGSFQIGDHYYEPEVLRTAFAGVSMSDHVKEGAVIIFTGCNAGAEPGGTELMREFGRIFFGDKKGTLQANTCPITAVLGVTTTTCDPVEFLYPEMQKRTAEDILYETYQSAY